MAADLAELTTLEAKSSGIADLSGLEYCTNLTGLGLEENQISDLSPFGGEHRTGHRRRGMA